MAYAQSAEYAGPVETAERQGTVKRLALETRESLIWTRDRLSSTLFRLRGASPPDGKDGGIQPPDPDHLVFVSNGNVGLANQINNLLQELEEYI